MTFQVPANVICDCDIEKMVNNISKFFHNVFGDIPPLDDSALTNLNNADYGDIFTMVIPWPSEQKLSVIHRYI